MRKFFASLTAAALAASAFASVDFKITEVYIGLSGPDGTEDWIEVTNFGTTAGDTGTLIYDDESLSIADGGALDSFILQPGESAVFLIDSGAAEVATFQSVWGTGATVGTTADGGGLSQSGDTAALLDNVGNVIDAVTYDNSFNDVFATIDATNNPSLVASQIGVNGAYESNPFFNDDFGTPPEFQITLVGSPGLIPEPTSLALLAVGALVALRRR